MNDKYEIKHWQDNEYAVYYNGSDDRSDYLFRGTLEQINAWMSLQEKGFDISL